MTDDKQKQLPEKSTQKDIDAFLRKVAITPVNSPPGTRGRLIFALDATASREPTWDHACHIQGKMFDETTALGGLDIQLCYYRGVNEFNASPWMSNATQLHKAMSAVFCVGGNTRIASILSHAINESKQNRVNALVFVGDYVEEDIDHLCQLAGELGILRVPAFIFHEGADQVASMAFRQIARLTGGAYCRFNINSAQQLKDLLSAVAVYAAGGRTALDDFNKRKGNTVLQLTDQMRRKS